MDRSLFDEVHFFGDKTFEGGNDFEIYTHPGGEGPLGDGAVPLVDDTKSVMPKLASGRRAHAFSADGTAVE